MNLIGLLKVSSCSEVQRLYCLWPLDIEGWLMFPSHIVLELSHTAERAPCPDLNSLVVLGVKLGTRLSCAWHCC